MQILSLSLLSHSFCCLIISWKNEVLRTWSLRFVISQQLVISALILVDAVLVSLFLCCVLQQGWICIHFYLVFLSFSWCSICMGLAVKQLQLPFLINKNVSATINTSPWWLNWFSVQCKTKILVDPQKTLNFPVEFSMQSPFILTHLDPIK